MSTHIPTSADILLMEQAAWLHSEGRPQDQIARLLGRSQSTISRLIQRARSDDDPELQRLKVETRFLWENVPEERHEQIRAADSPVELQRELKRLAERYETRPVQQIRVVPTAERAPVAEGRPAGPLVGFGEAAAPYIRTLLKHSRYAGVSWGSTLESLVRGLRRQNLEPSRSHNPVQFVPLCGEPLGKTVTQYSASAIAAGLSSLINGEGHETPSLVGVPAHIPFPNDSPQAGADGSTPAPLTSKDHDAIWKLLEYAEYYREIFGDLDRRRASQSQPAEPAAGESPREDGPLIDRVDTILCSVGPATSPLSTLYRNFLRLMGPWEDVDQLSDLIDGDLCGIFLKRSRLDQVSRKNVRRMNASWTGINLNELKQCARQARYPQRPGVVVCAAGRKKVKPLLNALQRGLVNVMIIDQECHDELLLQVRDLV